MLQNIHSFLVIGWLATVVGKAAGAAPGTLREPDNPAGPPAGQETMMRITHLRCEYRTDPLGLDVQKPRLSWMLESTERGQQQTRYQIIVASSLEKLARLEGDVWNSGRVVSSQQNQIEYAGPPLSSRQRCWWKVRVWDQDGRTTAWSPPASWTMGLLDQSDWQARWIADPVLATTLPPSSAAGALPAMLVRKAFPVSGVVRRAWIYATSLGLYELRLNGHRVGDKTLRLESGQAYYEIESGEYLFPSKL